MSELNFTIISEKEKKDCTKIDMFFSVRSRVQNVESGESFGGQNSEFIIFEKANFTNFPQTQLEILTPSFQISDSSDISGFQMNFRYQNWIIKAKIFKQNGNFCQAKIEKIDRQND